MFALFATALADVPPPIVGGERTALYPQVVLLRRSDPSWSTVYVCSGTLVASEWVLTAAHCVDEEPGLTEMRAFVGDAWSDDAEEIEVADFFPHFDYHVSDDGIIIDNDVGLVRLASPLSVEPIPLNETALTTADVGEELRWVGWGASGDYTGDAGYLKRFTDMPLVGFEDEFLLGEDDDGSATCGGDSGGAVLRLGGGGSVTLVGVHSFGRDDDGTVCAGSTSGDTRVDLYVDWIRGYIGVDTAGGDTGEGPGDTGEGETGGADDTDSGTDDTDDRDTEEEDEEAAGCGCATGRADGLGWVMALGGAIAARRRPRPALDSPPAKR